MKKKLLAQLRQVTEIAAKSKLGRLLHDPVKYVQAVGFRTFFYNINKREKVVAANLFFGEKMNVALPAGTDIFLTGGKSHSSEIRLATYLILNLEEGHHFLDIGSHFGYFALLASKLVGEKGKVLAYEPSPKSFKILQQNTAQLSNIMAVHSAASNVVDKLTFYEFPARYSEYNAFDVTQYQDEAWYKSFPPQKITVQTTTIDAIVSETFLPQIVKIDVEGAEDIVIAGGEQFFKNHSTKIVMEFLRADRQNAAHKKAAAQLASLCYAPHVIQDDGTLVKTLDIDTYLQQQNLDSDNIVFILQHD